MMKSYTLFFSLLTLSLFSSSLGSASVTERLPTLGAREWQIFLKYVRVWRGLSLRYNPDSSIHIESFALRNFTKLDAPPPNEEVLFSLTYSNPSFSSSGMSFRQFKYFQGEPPRYGVQLFPNGTLGTGIQSGTIAFFPSSWGTWTSNTILAPVFFLEKFIINPVDNNIRMGLLFVYRGPMGSLSRVSFSRDEADIDSYPSRYWTSARSASLVPRFPARKATWSAAQDCVSAGLSYRRKLSFTNVVPNLPGGSARFIMQLPDGVHISSMKNVGPMLAGKKQKIYVDWTVDERTVMREVIVFGTDGRFLKDCITTYQKIF